MHTPSGSDWRSDKDLDTELEFERNISGGHESSTRRVSLRSSVAGTSSAAVIKGRNKAARLTILKAGGVLVLVSVMISVCLAIFLSEENRKQADFRTSVSDLGLIYANDIERQVRSSVSSVRALEAMIKVDDKNLTMDNFDSIAQTLIDTYQGISNLQLAPYGTVTLIHPLVAPGQDNRGAVGHALLVDPTRRAGALSTISRGQTTVVGPLRLIQGGIAIIARHPIFTKFAPEFVPAEPWTGKDGTVHTIDCSTPAAQRANCYFPGPTQGNATPIYFWGFATMLTTVGDLLAPVKLERLAQGNYRIGGVSRFEYQLSSPIPHSSMTNVNGVFAHSAGAPPGSTSLEDPVDLPVKVSELGMEFVMRLAPVDGWPATSSDFWVQVALLFPLTILVAVGLSFALLGNLRANYLRTKDLEQYRLGRLQQTVHSAVNSLDRLHFPMCLMTMDDFEKLERLVPHEVVRDQGKLLFFDKCELIRQLRDEEGVVFISHQWAGFTEPDPQGIQYRAMLDAVRALRQRGIRCRWIWVDYLCIPQQNKSQQQNAIDSLTVYVAHSSVFVTVAPAVQHADHDVILDIGTYGGRGWCRLEQLSYLASTISREAPAAYACTESGLSPLWGKCGVCQEIDALCVVEGEFTCCSRGHPNGCPCDKTKLVGVMLGIYWRILAWNRDLPNASDRLIKMLRRFESNGDKLFPGSVAYASESGKLGQVEVFGDLIPVMHAMFAADSKLEPDEQIKVPPPSTAAMPISSEEDFARYAQQEPLTWDEPKEIRKCDAARVLL